MVAFNFQYNEDEDDENHQQTRYHEEYDGNYDEEDHLTQKRFRDDDPLNLLPRTPPWLRGNERPPTLFGNKKRIEIGAAGAAGTAGEEQAPTSGADPQNGDVTPSGKGVAEETSGDGGVSATKGAISDSKRQAERLKAAKYAEEMLKSYEEEEKSARKERVQAKRKALVERGELISSPPSGPPSIQVMSSLKVAKGLREWWSKWETGAEGTGRKEGVKEDRKEVDGGADEGLNDGVREQQEQARVKGIEERGTTGDEVEQQRGRETSESLRLPATSTESSDGDEYGEKDHDDNYAGGSEGGTSIRYSFGSTAGGDAVTVAEEALHRPTDQDESPLQYTSAGSSGGGESGYGGGGSVVASRGERRQRKRQPPAHRHSFSDRVSFLQRSSERPHSRGSSVSAYSEAELSTTSTATLADNLQVRRGGYGKRR